MHSAFTQIPLDRLRYGLVWEDYRTLYRALALGPGDHILLITSAGCNALNALLANLRRVTAIGLNPVQNQLLALKMHVIAHYSPAVLLGLAGPAAVAGATAKQRATLPAAAYARWAAYLAQHSGGLLLAGQLEGYVTGFVPTLPAAWQARLRHLLTCGTVAAQAAYFEAELNQFGFRTRFIDYFDAANLSRGRAPRLYSHAADAGGATFFERRRHLGWHLARDNFFFRFLFFGPENLPEETPPLCY